MSEVNSEIHSVFDEASLQRQVLGDEKEKYRQGLLDRVDAAKATIRYLDVNNMTSFEHQAGKQMQIEEFETKIKRLVPDIVFVTDTPPTWKCDWLHLPRGTKLRAAGRVLPDGSSEILLSFIQRPLLPEFTVILTHKVQHPTLLANVNALDFPKAERVEQPDGTFKWEFAGPTPLDNWIDEPCGTIPGWRSALVLLVAKGLTNPTAVARVFGDADRASWAVRLGRRQIDIQV